MKHMREGRLWPPIVPTVMAVSLLLCGCPSDSSSSVSEDTRIRISEDRYWFNGRSFHDWRTKATTARVEVKVRGYHRGTFRVRVFDGDGVRILDRSYSRGGNGWIIGGNEFFDVTFTKEGAPGLWTIRIDFSEFTGHLYLTLTDTSSPPEETVARLDEVSTLLDPTFGDDGLGVSTPDQGFGADIALDSMGRVLVVGTLVDADGVRRIGVWRFTADGALDGTFGTEGVFRWDTVEPSGALGVAVDEANRVLVTGWQTGSDDTTVLALLRLTVDGALDGSFGTGGVVTFDQNEDEIGFSVALDGSGNVLVVGATRDRTNTDGSLLLLRLTDAGVLDGTFGMGGVVLTSNTTDRGRDLVVDGSDRPVVLGERDGGLALWRFTTDGDLDATFGTGGVTTDGGEAGEASIALALAQRADGALAATGLRFFDDGDDERVDLAVWLFSAAGGSDNTFGTGGFVTNGLPDSAAAGTGVAFDSTGRVVVVGGTRTAGTDLSDAAATLWRFLSTGDLDATVVGSDGTGVVLFDVRGPDIASAATGIAPTPGDEFLAGGGVIDHTTSAVDLVVWNLAP